MSSRDVREYTAQVGSHVSLDNASRAIASKGGVVTRTDLDAGLIAFEATTAAIKQIRSLNCITVETVLEKEEPSVH